MQYSSFTLWEFGYLINFIKPESRKDGKKLLIAPSWANAGNVELMLENTEDR
jgi:hypothetical protein